MEFCNTLRKKVAIMVERITKYLQGKEVPNIMDSMEQKKKIDERIESLEQRMKEHYEIIFEVLGKKCFKARIYAENY